MAWIRLGFAEQLEFLSTLTDAHSASLTPHFSDSLKSDLKSTVMDTYLNAAQVTAQWYCLNSFSDGMVYWDSGAPQLLRPVHDSNAPSAPYNDDEPIDSSAAAIAGQGFIRLGQYLDHRKPGA
ncbi:MAG: hypothetical protein ACYCUV_00280 [Phycisphaerae bacterium]